MFGEISDCYLSNFLGIDPRLEVVWESMEYVC